MYRENSKLVQGSCHLRCFTDSEGALNRPQEQPGEAGKLLPLVQAVRYKRWFEMVELRPTSGTHDAFEWTR